MIPTVGTKDVKAREPVSCAGGGWGPSESAKRVGPAARGGHSPAWAQGIGPAAYKLALDQ